MKKIMILVLLLNSSCALQTRKEVSFIEKREQSILNCLLKLRSARFKQELIGDLCAGVYQDN